MLNGTLSLYGFDIEWCATESLDDGFDWRIQWPTENGKAISAEDRADLMLGYYADIEQAVREAYVAARDEHNEYMREAA